MRHILFFLTIILLTALCACAPAQPVLPAPPPVVPEPQEPTPLIEPEPIVVGPGQPAEPEPPSRYVPTPTIVPLVNSRRIYTNCVIGEVTFIRTADQSRVELPAGVFNYAPVRAEEDGAVIAYALIGDESAEYRMAFMDVDGVMLTDFVYESFGEDYIHFPNRYGYITVQREGKQGLLNLADGQEVITPQYDTLAPGKSLVVTINEEQTLLLDYAGNPYNLNSLPERLFYDEDNRWVEENLERLNADIYRRIRFEPAYSQQLEDSQGNIIIPFGVYGYIYVYGPFIIGRSEENSDPDFDILNMNGELLLHNPLGAITYEGGLADKLVVWLDEQNCVFLYPDGSTEPIANPPQVELMYFGG